MSEFGKGGSAAQDWGNESGEHRSSRPQQQPWRSASEVLSPRGMAAMQGPAEHEQTESPEPHFAQAERPIKNFLDRFYGPDQLAVQSQYRGMVDVTDPRQADADAIASGDYLVRNIRVLPELNHVVCYVGATEFHFSGLAAQEIIAEIKK